METQTITCKGLTFHTRPNTTDKKVKQVDTLEEWTFFPSGVPVYCQRI